MDRKEPGTIAIASIKGGVGKSTLTILFSYVLKNLGKKVLLIDLDPQNSLSSYFRKYISDIKKYNIFNILKGDVCFNQCINKINDFIYFIPSHPVLEKFNKENIESKEILLEYYLSKNIVSYDFDYIIIDTPPSFNFLLENALNSTNYIIIPIQLERLSIESLEILIEKIVTEIQCFKNKNYNISIIENQFIKNRNTMKNFENVLYEEYGKYIKGKIHSYNSVRVFMNDLLEPNPKEKYYKEAKDALNNILCLY